MADEGMPSGRVDGAASFPESVAESGPEPGPEPAAAGGARPDAEATAPLGAAGVAEFGAEPGEPREERANAGYAVRVGGTVSGQLAIGDHIVMIHAEHGSTVAMGPGEPPRVQRRRRPVGRPLPRRGPELLGRDAEVARVRQALDDGLPVQVFGTPGIGKSALLRQVAAGCAAEGRDVVFLSAAGLTLEDLVQELFQACYDAENYRPEPDRLRRLMGSIQALLVVDDFAGAAGDLAALLDCAPACDVLVASASRSLGGDGFALALPGLAEEASLALLTRELRRPLREDELAVATALRQAAQGHPAALVQAAAALRTAESARPAAEVPLPADSAQVASVLAARLSESARRVLGVLCAMPALGASAALLAVLTGEPTDETAVAELVEARLAEPGPAGYQAAGSTAALVAEHAAATADQGGFAARLVSWIQVTATFQDVADAAPVIQHALRAAAAAGQHPAVRDLARVAAPALARTLRWGSWREVLALGRQAAAHLGSAVDEAYFAREEGVRQRALGRGLLVGAGLGAAALGGNAIATSAAKTTAASAASRGAKAGAKGGIKGVATNPVTIGAAAAVAVVAVAATIVFYGPSNSSNPSSPPTPQDGQAAELTTEPETSSPSAETSASATTVLGSTAPSSRVSVSNAPAPVVVGCVPGQTIDDFGDVPVGAEVHKTYSFSSDSCHPEGLDTADMAFRPAGGPFRLIRTSCPDVTTPADTCTVDIVFHPQASGSFQAVLYMPEQGNAGKGYGGHGELPVTGRGVAPTSTPPPTTAVTTPPTSASTSRPPTSPPTTKGTSTPPHT
jgi:hypothetical protein